MIDDIDRRFRRLEPKPIALEPQRHGDPCPAPRCAGHLFVRRNINDATGTSERFMACCDCGTPASNPVFER